MMHDNDLVLLREGGLAPIKELRAALGRVHIVAVVLEPPGGCKGG
ncbi:MAG: hypothetical protein ACO3JL_19815 [Myxococcota bacterium]